MKKYLITLSIAISAFITFSANGAEQTKEWDLSNRDINNYGTGALTTVPEDCKPYLFAQKKDLKWFENAKFGIFCHWDPSSIMNAEISWHRFGPRAGSRHQAKGGIPVNIYDNLYKKFNPKNFNADEWIKMVKDAGAKYFIFTTKHHDGFCMFDAKNTNYKITNSPYGKDICKELADACHKYGIKLFWYYSQPDWHHPDYLTKNHQKYRKYMYEHLRQLLTEYGQINGIWFDNLNSRWQHWNTPLMLKMIRTLQPGCLVNARWGGGKIPGVKDCGDYDTPEQKLGAFKIDRPWETCATMGGGWSWRGQRTRMSATSCIRMLISCVGAGGNLALNFGPDSDGILLKEEKANFLAMGKWLNKYGDAIYGTRGGPYKPGLYGVSCNKGKNIYIHVTATFSSQETPQISLPRLPVKILKATTYSGQPIKINYEQDKMILDLSKIELNSIDNIIILKIADNADKIKPISLDMKKRLVSIKAAKASSFKESSKPDALITIKKGKFTAGIHQSASWCANGPETPKWVELTFDKPEQINGISLIEQPNSFLIKDFAVEYDCNGTWIPVYKSDNQELPLGFSLLFKPVKTSKVRLLILKTRKNRKNPGIQSFKVYRAQ